MENRNQTIEKVPLRDSFVSEIGISDSILRDSEHYYANFINHIYIYIRIYKDALETLIS